MADKRISQLVERTTLDNSDVVPIVASGAATTNKATISTIQDYLQNNLDLGVTSVGLSMPSAFVVSSSPVTSSGNISVSGAGTVSQYVRGDGSLANFPTSTGGGSSISYYLNGSVSQGTIGGVAYLEAAKVPILGAGTDFTIAADGYVASFITDAGDPGLLAIPAGNFNFETFFSVNNNSGSPTFYIELYKVSGVTATLIATNSATPVAINFGTTIHTYFSTLSVPQTTLLITDRLAFRYFVSNSGRTITMHTENSHLCQIITTFSTGITALNGLTAQVQNLGTGTSGTDFSISSTGTTHTFNLPTASAANRGALSSADWITFNAKQPAGNYVTTDTNQTITGEKTFSGTALQLAGAGTASPTIIRNVSGTTGSTGGFNTIGFNSSNNIFVDTPNKGGFLFGFNNSVSNRTYTFKDASGTIAFTSDITSGLAGYVTLATAQTITEAKTFTNSIILKNSPSLAGFIINSFSPNAFEVGATILGTTYYSSFVFPAGAQSWNLPNSTGTLALTSNLAAYLPLTGGTLAGALNGTSLNFSGDVQSGTRLSAVNSTHTINLTANLSGTTNRLETTGSLPLSLVTAGASITLAAGGVTPQLTLSSAGNLGLGVTPSTWNVNGKILEIGYSGGNAAFFQNGADDFWTTSNAVFNSDWKYVKNGTSTAKLMSGGSHYWYNAPSGTAGNAITFTQAMTLNASGNVGIGTPIPAKTLEIRNTAEQLRISYAADVYTDFRNDSAGGLLIKTTGPYIINYLGGSEKTRLTSTGLGIGITPSYQLQLSTDSAAKPTSALWTIASDERIKENVQPYEKGLAELLQINAITYDYNGLGGFTKGKGGVGIIAQEIMDILPDSISLIKAKLNEEDEEQTDILNFNGHELTYILINAIKELNEKITQLENK